MKRLYYDSDGKLVTGSFKDYTRKTLQGQFASLDAFIKRWKAADRKQAVLDELADAGILWEALAEDVGRDLDPFDLICHVVFDQPPLTRRERAENVKKRNYFTRYSEPAQAVLNALLDKYADVGVVEIENIQTLKAPPFTGMGAPMEIVKGAFGSKAAYEQAVSELEAMLYA
ncbi:type I restriction-modification enzyme R subunit C-terminal domain-containing protein [Thiothrix nivea]|uniref:type I restriction-modification enzyme R subunit C-terminal domain-containing protein n=1 Tax=Thiothrix nivea TaxID=1031 RepID=UPI000316A1BB|nr:type I restriction-modification enzyme R subunit C-terminal domain-containing protein [Thiothrix nivea]